MPEITVSMAAGRTDEQKAGMMRDITQALVKNLGVDADAVVIQINEAPLAHKMKGGKTFVERGGAEKVTRSCVVPANRAKAGPIPPTSMMRKASAVALLTDITRYGSRRSPGRHCRFAHRNHPWTHATSSRSA